MNSVFLWKRTFELVFMARSSPPGLCNVNNLAGNLFLKTPAHIPPSDVTFVTFDKKMWRVTFITFLGRMEGTGTWQDYLVKRDDQKNEGRFGEKIVQKSRNIWKRLGLWVHRDSWLRAQNKRSKNVFVVTSIALIIGHDWLRWLKPLARSLIGSPSTLEECDALAHDNIFFKLWRFCSHNSRKMSHFGPASTKLFWTGKNVTIRLGLKHAFLLPSQILSLISEAWSGKAIWATTDP